MPSTNVASRFPELVTNPVRFWWLHVRVPLLAFLITFSAIETTDADRRIAQAFFFDASLLRWVGAHNWWANEFMHTGGSWFVRVVVAAAVALWAATYMRAPLQWRRPSAYFALACVFGIGTVGLLKALLHVPCPWDLKDFGGRVAYVPLLVQRWPTPHISGCFPAAHAASGYALSSAYFVLRERSRRGALAALMVGLSVGLIFGTAQQSRGAHFVSHDLCSALLTWLIAATLYVFAFGARLWPAWQPRRDMLTMAPPHSSRSSIEAPAPQLQAPRLADLVRVLQRAAVRTRDG